MDADVAARFDAIDARFEQLIRALGQQFETVQQAIDRTRADLLEATDVRFGLVDRRFDEVDRRFQAVDQRFDTERALVAGQFEAMQKQIDRRFDAVDQRFTTERALFAGQFEAMQKHIDTRFDHLAVVLDTRFDNHERRLRRLESGG